jgi:hypothetical protein
VPVTISVLLRFSSTSRPYLARGPSSEYLLYRLKLRDSYFPPSSALNLNAALTGAVRLAWTSRVRVGAGARDDITKLHHPSFSPILHSDYLPASRSLEPNSVIPVSQAFNFELRLVILPSALPPSKAQPDDPFPPSLSLKRQVLRSSTWSPKARKRKNEESKWCYSSWRLHSVSTHSSAIQLLYLNAVERLGSFHSTFTDVWLNMPGEGSRDRSLRCVTYFVHLCHGLGRHGSLGRWMPESFRELRHADPLRLPGILHCVPNPRSRWSPRGRSSTCGRTTTVPGQHIIRPSTYPPAWMGKSLSFHSMWFTEHMIALWGHRSGKFT